MILYKGLLLYYSFASFSRQWKLMVFHSSLIDGMSPQVSKTPQHFDLSKQDSIIFLLRVFHTSVSWWIPAGVWVTVSLLKSPELFSVFWPISMMLLPGWFPLVLLFSRLPVPLPIFWGLFHIIIILLQLVSPHFHVQ